MEQTDSIDEREFEAAFHEAVANGSCIKWRYWVHQMPSLTAEQAARLMCGLDPDLFESLNSRPNRNDPGDLCKRARMIERLAIAEKHLADSAAGWLAWAKSRGFNVHDGFVLEVEAMNSAQADQEQPGPNPAPAAQVEPVTRSAAQGAVILETIRRVGHEPLSLPKNEAGKRGIKAVVRGELVAKHKLFPKDGRQFDKAWERLRAFKEIADGD